MKALLLLLIPSLACAWGEVTTGYGPYYENTGYTHMDLNTGKITLGTVRRQGDRVEVDRISADGYQSDTFEFRPNGIDHSTWGTGGN